MLAREYCDDIKKKDKPVILSHRNKFLINDIIYILIIIYYN
jgi:hypothetical protein